MTLRVVAGKARGRRLEVPEGASVRPTSDRVREALFNALTSLDAVAGATVLDLFAGSGALGIEALSRGAAHATIVDSDRRARATVEANLATTGLADVATVVAGDAAAHLGRTEDRYDLVLLDPPYDFDRWADLQGLVLDHLAADALVVIESDRTVPPVAPLVVVRERRYGGTVVLFSRQELGPVPPVGVNE